MIPGSEPINTLLGRELFLVMSEAVAFHEWQRWN